MCMDKALGVTSATMLQIAVKESQIQRLDNIIEQWGDHILQMQKQRL